MSKKLYLVYIDSTDTNFAKGHIWWYGDDEKKALQEFKSYTRRSTRHGKVRMKCIDLDTLDDYVTPNKSDEMIKQLHANVFNGLNYFSPRCIATKDGGVTVSFTSNTLKPAKDYTGFRRSSVSAVHMNEFVYQDQEQLAWFHVSKIILDSRMKDIEMITPVKINIDGKTYKKYNKQ